MCDPSKLLIKEDMDDDGAYSAFSYLLCSLGNLNSCGRYRVEGEGPMSFAQARRDNSGNFVR